MRKICPRKISRKFVRENHGFTLVELLITISIISILFSLSIAQYMKFNRQQVLNQTILELKTNLTNAQSMALAGKKDCEGTFDGILVEFRDEAGAPSNEKYKLSSSCNNGADLKQIGDFYQYPQGIEKNEGPEEILFKALSGGTNLDLEKTITLDGSGVKVAPSGRIELVP